MTHLRALASVAPLALAAAACDPLYGMDVRQALRPAPTADCMAGALAASPRVSSFQPVETRGGRRRYQVSLRGPHGGARWFGYVEREGAEGDTAADVRVSYLWMAHDAPRRETHPEMRAAAADVLEAVRAACAPETPPAPVCEMVGPLRPRTCEPAAPSPSPSLPASETAGRVRADSRGTGRA